MSICFRNYQGENKVDDDFEELERAARFPRSIWHKGEEVIVAAEYYGTKRTYLLTAYKCSKLKAPR